jgi:hypothetical protein
MKTKPLILSLQGGQVLTNVDMMPHALRENRPNREDTNQAAETIEILLAQCRRMQRELVEARATLNATRRYASLGGDDAIEKECGRVSRRITNLFKELRRAQR